MFENPEIARVKHLGFLREERNWGIGSKMIRRKGQENHEGGDERARKP